MKTIRKVFLASATLVLLAIVAIGCSASATPTQVPQFDQSGASAAALTSTPIVVPTQTPEAAATSTPQPPEPTKSPTPTMIPTATATPAPFVDISPDEVTIIEGTGLQLLVETNISGANIAWSSSNIDIVEVSPNGFALGKAAGTAEVTVALGEVRDSTEVIVAHGPVASVHIRHFARTNFQAILNDEAGHALNDREIMWFSSEPDVAAIDKVTGELSVNKVGAAVITAISEDVADSVNVSVKPILGPTLDKLVLIFVPNSPISDDRNLQFFINDEQSGDANTLDEMDSGIILWVLVAENVELEIKGVPFRLSCINLGAPNEDCWNLIVSP